MTGMFRRPLPPQWQPGDPIVIHLQQAGLKRILYPVLLAMLGATMLASAIIWYRSEDNAIYLGPAAAGALLLPVAAFLWLRPRQPEPNLVVVEPPGIRWSDRDSSWAIAWTELAAVSITTSKTWGGYGYALTKQAYRTVWVRVDLYPGDPGFQQRHPELEPFWEAAGARQCYRVPLGDIENELLGLDNGLRMYAQGRYHGVNDSGWSLSPFRSQ